MKNFFFTFIPLVLYVLKLNYFLNSSDLTKMHRENTSSVFLLSQFTISLRTLKIMETSVTHYFMEGSCKFTTYL